MTPRSRQRLRRALAMAAGALLALASTRSPASATRACVKPCRAATAACTRTRCAGLAGAARRECVETCRGMGGCAAIRTFAYVVTECRSDARGIVGRQELRIRRGNCAPVVVATVEAGTPQPDPIGICRLFGRLRAGGGSRLAGVFQRLNVSYDGSLVAFEVSDDHALFPIIRLAPEEEGIFVVRADGSALRRLGPASRLAPFKLYSTPTEIGIGVTYQGSALNFSPDGRTLALLDEGPGPDGVEAVQLVTLDVATGRRVQVTHLPDATPSDPSDLATFASNFLDNHTLVFRSYTNPEGLNPERDLELFRIGTDGTGLAVVRGPQLIDGARIIPDFSIAGGRKAMFNIRLPGVPENDIPAAYTPVVQEVFVLDGRRNLLQLTAFRRVDTAGGALSPDGRRAIFRASADPLGTNPTHNCQMFSIDTLGTDLRQLTDFRQGDQSVNGCGSGPPPGCHIGGIWWDGVMDSLVFFGTCDPFGLDHYGERVFASRTNGKSIRLLTDTRGFVEYADGSVSVEQPGPVSYVANGPAWRAAGR